MQTSTIQSYALLYCQYDSAFGSRRYDLLTEETIAQLDSAVAKIAEKTEPASEITKIIYFGSPNAQQLTNHNERYQYALSIVEQLNK